MTQIKVNVNNQPMNVISPISLNELVALKQINVDGTAIADQSDRLIHPENMINSQP